VGWALLYEAEEELSGRRVALKMLTPERSREEQARATFLEEIRELSRVDHPNLLRGLAAQEIDGQRVLVLESLAGKTLRQVLTEGGPLPWASASAQLLQVASALGALHGATPPSLHGDIRPENVLQQPDGRLKLLDGATARVLSPDPIADPRGLETLRYTSPEQIEGRALDARSDLYQLGLLFFELLAGHPPFRGVSPRELMEQQCTAPPLLDDVVRKDLPRGVEALLLRLLAKAPGDRPASAREVTSALSAFLPSGDPPSPSNPTTPSSGPTPTSGLTPPSSGLARSSSGLTPPSSGPTPSGPPRAEVVLASPATPVIAAPTSGALAPRPSGALTTTPREPPAGWQDREIPTPVAIGVLATISLLVAALVAALRSFL
jgi:serine/threonine-protein kinase